MTDQHRVRVVELEAERTIAGLGFEPTPIMPLIKEAAIEYPELNATDIVAIIRSENPAAFKARTVETKLAERSLSDMSEKEKADFIDAKGLDAYMKLITRDSEKRRAAMQKKTRGY